jgi:hypothetical protein
MRRAILRTLQAIDAQNKAIDDLLSCSIRDIIDGTALERLQALNEASFNLGEKANALAELELMAFNLDGTVSNPDLLNRKPLGEI